MINNITIRPIALKEIEEAYQWYESRRDGLGDDFLLCVEESLEKISRNPKLYPAVHNSEKDTQNSDSSFPIWHSLFY